MAWTAPKTFTVGEILTAATMNQQLRDNLKALAPVGSLIFLIRNPTTVETLVEGAWLECNGVQVSRTTYADLDAYLAALTPARPFGVGNGSTTVHLPDLAGRVPVHVDNASRTGAKADALGEAGGAHEHALATTELAAHAHGDGTLGTASDGAHAHSLGYETTSLALSGTNKNHVASGGAVSYRDYREGAGADGAHSHDVTGSTGSAGSGSAHQNMQPFLAAGVWAVKAKT